MTPDSLFTPLLDAAVELAWRQWATIGSGAHARAGHGAIVDPEALVLLTVDLRSRDRRLHELLHHWVIAHSRLLSAQRAKNLSKRFQAESQNGLAGIAQLVLDRAKDVRWRTLAKADAPQPFAWVTRFSAPVLRLSSPAAVMLRLRLGFGVGIKADAIAYLIGTDGWATAAEIAGGVNYNLIAVRRGLDDLAAGGFIHVNEPQERRPVRSRQYRAEPRDWALAQLGETPPTWGYFAERFAFITHLLQWLNGPNGQQRWTDAQTGDWARTWVEQHPLAFRYRDRDDAQFRGTLEEWAAHFRQSIIRLTDWLRHEA